LHRNKYALSVLACLVAAGAWATFALGSSSGAASSATVVAKDNGVSISPNKYMQDNMFFSPGTVTVKSGGTITFKFDKPGSMEPHTMTILHQSDLPKTGAQAENCKPCERYATPHLKNPKAPPDQNNPIVHWTLNKGNPGFNTVGDSVAIQEPGEHKSVTIKVTAKPGTTLYFVCAVHPWMQGKIIVK
jgi:plastocyanin